MPSSSDLVEATNGSVTELMISQCHHKWEV